MTFVTRSRPFCRPKLHTTKPPITVRAIQSVISAGEASMAANTPSTASGVRPEKRPEANLTK